MNAHHPCSWLADLLLTASVVLHGPDKGAASKHTGPQPVAPAVSFDTGLLLKPALTLPGFTYETFAAAMSTVGSEKNHERWTNAVVMPPTHPRKHATGLTHDEVKAWFDARR